MVDIEIKHLYFGFDQQGTQLFSDINLSLSAQWKLALIGLNGRGKTTLLRLLMGDYHYTGDI
ncbi:MAG: ATP-binding cassette domain-containing protein, partial [Leuconostoc falkenbergense]